MADNMFDVYQKAHGETAAVRPTSPTRSERVRPEDLGKLSDALGKQFKNLVVDVKTARDNAILYAWQLNPKGNITVYTEKQGLHSVVLTGALMDLEFQF